MKKIITSALFIFFAAGSFAQITTETTTATNAVQNVLLGAGVTASNITYTVNASDGRNFSCYFQVLKHK